MKDGIDRQLEFFNSLMKILPDEIVVVNQDKIIVWSNNKDLEGCHLCYTLHDVNDGLHIIHDDGSIECPIDTVFINGGRKDFESEIDGEYWWHIVAPCNANGKIHTILEVRRNITSKKKIYEFQELRDLVKEVTIRQDKIREIIIKR